MRVLNPNYIWTCDPYTADHNKMLSKTFEMCDPVVDERKLDALFCGIICNSPPESPIFQASQVGDKSRDILSTRGVDLSRDLEGCNPAAKALAEVQVTASLFVEEPSKYAKDVSKVLGSRLHFSSSATNHTPSISAKTVNSRIAPVPASAGQRFINGKEHVAAQVLRPAVSFKTTRKATPTKTATRHAHGSPLSLCTPGSIVALPSGPIAPSQLAKNSVSLQDINPACFESRQQILSNLVPSNNIEREGVIQLGCASPLPATQAETFQTPIADPVPVIHRERLSSQTPVTVIQFLSDNKGKRKRSSDVESTGKKRRVEKKGKKVSSIVVDVAQLPPVEPSSSSTVLSTDDRNLPTKRRKRATKPKKEKPEVIDVDQEPLADASSNTFIPKPNGMRQLLPASMRPASSPLVPPMPPDNGFTMPSTSVAHPHMFSSASLPFNPTFPNNMEYGIPSDIGFMNNSSVPPEAFDQVPNYSAQHLERQRALLLRQQMQAQFQMNQPFGTNFIDPRLAPNPITSQIFGPPITANDGIWNHNSGIGPSSAYYQNLSSLPSQAQGMEAFDPFGVNWMPPVQTTGPLLPN